MEKLTPNDSIQLHKLLTLKNLNLTKSISMTPLIVDTDLKCILQKDAEISENHVKQLKGFMEFSIEP
jgi:similar to spore coat protein